MLAIILKILSVLGIMLLVLLGVILLILFFPISYSIDGAKNPQTTCLKIKVRWLFGLFRAGVVYPQPGRLLVKALWFTLFDSESSPGKKKGADSGNTTGAEEKSDQDIREDAVSHEVGRQASETEGPEPDKNAEKAESQQNVEEASKQNQRSEKKSTTLKEKLFAKYEKIKYTIKKICDKIKHILAEISFYKDLIQDEDTKLLFSHALKRLGLVLRHIRPRKLKADVTFGTGSPDTTGYVFAVYGMLSPWLGKDVCITPDFTEQILEGTFYAKGHITIFTILMNVCALAVDKRLRLLLRRIKNHSKITERQGN